MKFLMPSGGIIDSRFGILTSPASYGIPAGITAGLPWAADNQVFTKGFNPEKFFSWLKTMEPFKTTCLFITCPDVVGNAQTTIGLFDQWHRMFCGWPVAFVAQDGQENLEFPDSKLWDCLFIGGSTRWKMSQSAITCVQRAQKMNKHIHIGRVNWFRRYTHFRSLPGSEEFTCDGTRTRYGRNKAIEDWSKYMAHPKQYNIFVPTYDSAGEYE